ncbi:MAG: hypothetical protein G3M70_03760 [Candidatus Nitronauta litoralis]|uniref:DUF5666 domain-containing protein n=1 Tax=Candidatus Nitronauta litoralis TaxID=2705533 RepID=A0A7T0FZQ9_9BACT|nr:MAG: hypothetical protein G3M70_03760 [Candidatus Nitronauta litoralis]
MRRLIAVFVLIVSFILAGSVSPLLAGDAVPFSGKVKKVILKKNKVGIMNPESKKRVTVVIAESSKLTGYDDIEDIKKGDMVAGHYEVDGKGLYIVTEMEKK